MQLFRNLLSLPPHVKGTALALGNFDGLHLGHRAILDETLQQAKKLGAPAGVMTFEPHPREFFMPAAPSLRLMRLGDKIAGLRKMGFDYIFMPRFNQTLAATSAHDFVTNYLVAALGVQYVITGENFCFGAQRLGNHALLAEASRHYHFGYKAITPVCGDAGIISSSAIRSLLAEGKLDHIQRLLGRPTAISGHVLHGDKRGRTLGFPTANLSLSKLFVPRLGVYAVKIYGAGFAGQKGVANIGLRPTFGGGKKAQLEVHLFDFGGDLYGKKIRVELCAYLRDEQPFPSVEALKAQITRDCMDAKNLLV